jgi:hypothetical protein
MTAGVQRVRPEAGCWKTQPECKMENAKSWLIVAVFCILHSAFFIQGVPYSTP